MEEKFVCSCCGCEVSDNDVTYVGEDVLCPSCLESECLQCDCCGDYIYRSDDFGDGFTTLCEECYNNLVEDEYINDYDYKPEPIFYGEGNRYFEVELEVDKGGKYDEYARRVLDVANYNEEHIYVKSNGSLDDGFEIVSHPVGFTFTLAVLP
jgi:hypothetical protein